MIWSTLVGSAALAGIRMIQLANGEGHAGPFPVELMAFFASVQALLLLIVIGSMRWRSASAYGLLVLLAATPIITIIFLRTQNWAPDFMPLALIIEAVWLGPWILVALYLRKPRSL